MTGGFYRVLVACSRLVGSWFFVAVSRLIAAGYFVLSTKTGQSHAFYAALFPDRSPLYHRWCTFQQYQNFTTIHLDRMLLTEQAGSIAFTSEGLEYLEQVNNKKEGGIILMSHLGNWDIAAHLLLQQGMELDLLLYMGSRDRERVEKQQKEQLRQAGIRIIGIEQDSGSPFDGVEGINHLRAGGLLSLTGDLVWNQEQRVVEVDFLGKKARLPMAPYVFALLTGAPVLVFFSFRTGRNRYHFRLEKPIFIQPASRQQRQQAIEEAAQQYADLLERNLRAHPLEWYHFERFLK